MPSSNPSLDPRPQHPTFLHSLPHLPAQANPGGIAKCVGSFLPQFALSWKQAPLDHIVLPPPPCPLSVSAPFPCCALAPKQVDLGGACEERSTAGPLADALGWSGHLDHTFPTFTAVCNSLSLPPPLLHLVATQVDLGGACGERSASRPLADALGWRDAFLDHILLAPLLLRDAVEQARFTVKPDVLLAFPLPGPGEGAGAGAGAGREAEAGAGGVGWGPGAVDAALSRWQRDHGLAAPSGYGASLTAQVSGCG